MVVNSDVIQEIVRQALRNRDVIYEKAIKLYCQIVILHSKAQPNACEFLSVENVKKQVDELV